MQSHEKFSLEKLKNELGDFLPLDYSDFDLLRWLQGYDFKIDQVLPKLKHHIHVMNSFDFRNFEESEVMKTYWPWGLLDESGKNDDNLVFIECNGSIDADGILKSLSPSIIALSLLTGAEKIFQAIKSKETETGRQWGYIHIMDLDKFEWNQKQFSILTGPYKCIIKMFTEHYCEMLRKIIWVNAPSVAYYIFRLVKPFVPEKTRNKVLILGSNWRREILNHIAPDCLPVHWGGNMLDPVKKDDVYCSSRITMPPEKVDERFFWAPSSDENAPPTATFHKLTIPAWKRHLLTVRVTVADSQLSWRFWAQGDYGFGVFYAGESEAGAKEDDFEKMQMVFPYIDRMPGPNKVVERFSLQCPKTGFYKLVFNNGFSWVHSLKVSYLVKVMH